MQALPAGGTGAGLLLDGLRRYEVAPVQRHAAGQGLPRSFLQARRRNKSGDRGNRLRWHGTSSLVSNHRLDSVSAPVCGRVH